MKKFIGLTLCLICVTAAAATPPAQLPIVNAAARALGGADKLQAVRNISLAGYAQYAYQFGGGRISGDPNAPEKYIAGNELSRIYDLEHDRYQDAERLNFLFPFLLPFGHAWAPLTQRLDGDVAYDINGTNAVRVSAHRVGLQADGRHERRLHMTTNPIVLVRAMMDPATRMTSRESDGETIVDLTLKTGEKMTAGFDPTGLPKWARWSAPNTNTGQSNFTTYFSGWADATGDSGIKLPLAYSTRLSYRNVDYMKLYVDAYQVNTAIPDLSAPEAVRATPEPPSNEVPTITSKPIGKGLWRVDQGGTTIIEFADHVALFEANINVSVMKAVIAHARALVPGKPVTQLISSHNHFDHTAGLRQAVAEGLTVIQRKASESQFQDMVKHPAPDFPDDLARSPKELRFMAVEDHLRLSDSYQTVDIYWVPNNAHMADAIVAYIPSERLLIEGDLVTSAYEWQHWPDGFRDLIKKYNLNVERVSPVHPVGLVDGAATLTRAQAEELLKGGTERARQHCATQLAQNNRHPGCPIQSKYY